MEIFSKEEMYAADKYTIDTLGVPSEMLMENAAQAVLSAVLPRLDKSKHILVLAGKGNNGGDGIAIARRLRILGFPAKLLLLYPKDKIFGAAAFHLKLYESHGFSLEQTENADLLIEESDVIIDAVFGIGVRGELPETEKNIIGKVNKAKAQVISVDIPSGVSADGEVSDVAVNADVTVMIAFPKQSAYQYPAAAYYGERLVADIGIFSPEQTVHRQIWGKKNFAETFPERKPYTHKGDYGRALIIGGSGDMPGAPIIAAMGCYHSGIGLLKLAVLKELKSAATAHIPEATYLTCEEQNGCLVFCSVPEDTDVIACGPGLSRNPAVAPIVRSLLKTDCPLVLDADALYFLPLFISDLKKRTAATILTPHSGEMARLCDCTVADIEKNRFSVSREKAVEWGCYIVLKGPFTIVTTPTGDQFVNQSGNEALAKGGSGDLLTGMIAGFLPAHKSVQQAVSNAVYAHGLAADICLKDGRNTCEIAPTELINVFDRVFSQTKGESL